MADLGVTPEETLVVEDNENGIAPRRRPAPSPRRRGPRTSRSTRSARGSSPPSGRRGGGSVKLLVLMAGDSDAFEEAGHTYPKNLVEIDGLPLVQRVVENLSPVIERASRAIFLVPQDEDRRFHTGDVIRLLAPERRRSSPSPRSSPARPAPRCTRSRTSAATSRCLCSTATRSSTAISPAIVAGFSRRPRRQASCVRRRASALVVRALGDEAVIEAAEKRPDQPRGDRRRVLVPPRRRLRRGRHEHDPQGRVRRGSLLRLPGVQRAGPAQASGSARDSSTATGTSRSPRRTGSRCSRSFWLVDAP